MLEENSGSTSQEVKEQDVQTDTQDSGQQSNDALSQEKFYSQKQRQRAQKAEAELEKMTARNKKIAEDAMVEQNKFKELWEQDKDDAEWARGYRKDRRASLLTKLPEDKREKFEKMNLEKINEKIDLIINKIEGLFNGENKDVEVLNKSEVEATLNAEIEGLKELYEWQINEGADSLKAKDEEINNLKLNFEESLKELNEKVEKLEANETKAVKEEAAPAVEEKASEANAFDCVAEKMRW